MGSVLREIQIRKLICEILFKSAPADNLSRYVAVCSELEQQRQGERDVLVSRIEFLNHLVAVEKGLLFCESSEVFDRHARQVRMLSLHPLNNDEPDNRLGEDCNCGQNLQHHPDCIHIIISNTSGFHPSQRQWLCRCCKGRVAATAV